MENSDSIVHNAQYLLKDNKFLHVLKNGEDMSCLSLSLKCTINNVDNIIVINYEKIDIQYRPSYIIIDSDNDDLCKKIEFINENIDNYEFIEDVIYELLKFINNKTRIISLSLLKKIINNYRESLFKSKIDFNIENKKSMMSYDASIEMVCDKLIKIHKKLLQKQSQKAVQDWLAYVMVLVIVMYANYLRIIFEELGIRV
jgi:hypothetical protein